MKICIVAPEHPNSHLHGGIARYLKDYIEELKQKVDVVLISIEDAKAIEGVKQYVIQSPPWGPLCSLIYASKINSLIEKIKPDCVEYANYRGLGVLAQRECASVCRLSTPVISGSLRAGLLPKLARPLHHLMEVKTVKNMDLWISNTQENLRKCQDIYQMSKPYEIIPHGLDLGIYEGNESKDILFVGRYEDRKGLDILFEAWKIIQQDELGAEYTLHLVGRDTPGESGSYLQDMLDKTAVDQSRIIDHGALDNKSLHELRKQCSISIVSSRYESFGMVVLEAFAYHQVVFASAVGGLKEVVRNGENGILFEMGNSQDLATKFLATVKDSEKRQRIIDQGLRDLSERFTVKAMVQSSLKAYEKAIALYKNR